MAIQLINPLDITLGIVFFSLIFYSSKNSAKNEAIKLVGSFIALLLSFHYYAKLGHFFKKQNLAPQGAHDLFALLFIAGIILLSFSILVHTWGSSSKFKPEDDSWQWLSVVCGSMRSYIFCGLIVTILFCSGNEVLVNSVGRSVSKDMWGKGAARIYHAVYSKFIYSLFPNEKINKEIFQLYEIPLEEKFREEEAS